MADQSLFAAVELLTQRTAPLPDAELERDWTWRYHDEGLRFALIGTYHELCDLAATTLALRAAHGLPRNAAQHRLAQYHAAYRDLQAVLICVDDVQAARVPAPNEWPIWSAVWHIMVAEQQFYARILDALRQRRAGVSAPPRLTDAGLLALLAEDPRTDRLRLMQLFYGVALQRIEDLDTLPDPEAPAEPFSTLMAYYDGMHAVVLEQLAGMTDAELDTPSIWWEEQPIPATYRLHRLDAHMRQHTVQVEKALDLLGNRPNEARRLLRLIYAALAEAEGAALGAWEQTAALRREVAELIVQRTDEVAGLLA